MKIILKKMLKLIYKNHRSSRKIFLTKSGEESYFSAIKLSMSSECAVVIVKFRIIN